MKTREQSELENMALVAELSRQLAHDFSNFVYNVVLQIELWERQKSGPGDWQPMKREAKKMTALLRNWDRIHHRTAAEEPAQIDVHQLLRRVVADLAANPPVQLAPSVSNGPIWISSGPLAVKHLFTLALEDAARTLHESNCKKTALSIQTEQAADKVIVRIGTQVETVGPPLHDANINDWPPSLLTAACESLARRLDASIRREQSEAGLAMIEIEFPL